MQANKNGFYYVLDRRSGRLLSANPFAYVNWASHVDLATGRPLVTSQADWYAHPKTIYPSWAGAHTWPPMSYSEQTHLAYIPVVDVPAVWVDLLHNGGSVKYIDGFFTVNGVIVDDTYNAADLKSLYGPLPDMAAIEAVRPQQKPTRELLRAFDPLTGKTAWEVETSSGIRGYDGGVMSTASNLVFQGRGSGELWAYAADSGQVLAKIPTGSHILAAPMTYSVKGEQYVAVQVGYGGAAITIGPIPPSSAALTHENVNRIIAFKLGGGPVPAPPPRDDGPVPQPPIQSASEPAIRAGEVMFVQECSRCHVLGPSSTPDLRRLTPELHAAFKDIVLHGMLGTAGMERFDDLISEQDADNIHAYLIEQAWIAYRAQEAAAPAH
jgi:quinohemoprotein ethanol dehydrogenase